LDAVADAGRGTGALRPLHHRAHVEGGRVRDVLIEHALALVLRHRQLIAIGVSGADDSGRLAAYPAVRDRRVDRRHVDRSDVLRADQAERAIGALWDRLAVAALQTHVDGDLVDLADVELRSHGVEA